MEVLIYINTIINILLFGWLIYKNNRLYVKADRSDDYNTLLGIRLWLSNYPLVENNGGGRGLLYLPIRNAEKIETREDVLQLIAANPQKRTQSLHAIFSWLKTSEEVEQFQKDYSIVDEVLVRKLVDEFKIQNNR